MNFTYVNSSDIKAIAVRGNNLVIEFHSGGLYEYIGAACEHSSLLNAESKGKYFHQHIKDIYPFRKI